MLFHEIAETSRIGRCRLNLNGHFGLCGWLLGTVCEGKDPMAGSDIPRLLKISLGIIS
jgi:hypothetical protein